MQNSSNKSRELGTNQNSRQEVIPDGHIISKNRQINPMDTDQITSRQEETPDWHKKQDYAIVEKRLLLFIQALLFFSFFRYLSIRRFHAVKWSG